MSTLPPLHDAAPRTLLRRALSTAGYEVVPLKGTEEAVLAHVPVDLPLTVTASPAKGQDVTIDLAARLARRGYSVAPHLSAQQVRDRKHLADVVARCRASGITGAFVVGGDALPAQRRPSETRSSCCGLCMNSITG